MRFGGHETFAIREGWLHKGLKLLDEHPERLVDEDACDFLGVGRNMAKSIRHWLLATGLAQPPADGKTAEKPVLAATPFGDLVWKHDPYFTEPGTWCGIHVNLVNCSEHALTWTWFFNSFHFDRFDRAVCLEGLRPTWSFPAAHAQPANAGPGRGLPFGQLCPRDPRGGRRSGRGQRLPAAGTGLAELFQDLGLLPGHQGRKEIPAEILGYALSRAFRDAAEGKGATDILLLDAARAAGEPGRAFLLTAEALFEVGHPGRVQFQRRRNRDCGPCGSPGDPRGRAPPLDWLLQYYRNADKKDRHAA